METNIIFDGTYFICIDGTVINTKKNKNVKFKVDSTGYLAGCMYNKKVRLHRVLALVYKPNPYNLPTVNHIDGNRLNNSLGNLEWVSYSGNNQHAHDTIPRKTVRKLSLEAIDHIVNSGLSTTQLMELYPVSRQHINSLKRGKYHVEYTRSITDA